VRQDNASTLASTQSGTCYGDVQWLKSSSREQLKATEKSRCSDVIDEADTLEMSMVSVVLSGVF